MIYEVTMEKRAVFLVEATSVEAAEQQATELCDEAMAASDDIRFVGYGIEEMPLHDAINRYGKFHKPINSQRALVEILTAEQEI